MTRSDGSDEEIWGTREELLLACAVSRHGTQSWDSVAMEVQARSPFSHLLTAQTCKRRYHDLQRRFAAESRGIDGGGGAESGAIHLHEALRRLHVAELRREVERYDVSIVSLQLKVKRLKEDRERSLQEEQSGDKSDPPEVEGAKKEETGSPAADRAIDGESGRSCNESNSTEPKGGQDPRAAEDGQLDGAAGSALRADLPAGDDEKLAGEGSYNGSSDTVAKGGAEAATPAEEPAAAKQPDAGESGESVAESKGEASKESSDVQSSVSLSRRRRGRRKAASGGSSGGEEAEAEADEVSPVRGRDAPKSQPLASFLQMIRSHKHGSVFERRLESQESARYRSLIRQHMDLGMVHSKMEEGAYAADVEFYRDLLLLCTNAVVFFPRNSAEHTAAVQLRELVRKQVPAVIQKPVPETPPPPPPPPPLAAEEPAAQPPPPPPPPPPAVARQPVATKMKAEPVPPAALLDKPIAGPPLVACRKRSSISGKAAVKAVATVKAEEKPEPDKKEVEKETERKRTKERSTVVGTRGLRTSKGRGSNSGASAGGNKNSVPAPAPADNAIGTAKAERKNTSGNNAANTPASSVAKKRSAMNNFLTRMNRSGASSNGTLLETLKSSGVKGGEQRKGGRTEGRKDARQGSGGAGSSGKQAREQSTLVKRSVGRPPKRPPPPLPPPPAKRTREVEAEVPPPTRTAAAKKRGRR